MANINIPKKSLQKNNSIVNVVKPFLGVKQSLLLEKLKIFYEKKEHVEELLPILLGETKLSLRIIDWFVTNYAKKHYIVLNNTKHIVKKISPKTKKVKSENKSEQFNVFLKYKSQLRAYSKKQFDPFCRRERINFYYQPDKSIVTTVGQINFFRWAIENGVIKYIKDNLESIENDMNQNIKKNKSKTKTKKKDGLCVQDSKKRQKRRELSVSATKTINKQNTHIELSFD